MRFSFPAVSVNHAGVRVLVSLYQNEDDIRGLLIALKEEYEIIAQKHKISIEDILKPYRKEKIQSEKFHL